MSYEHPSLGLIEELEMELYKNAARIPSEDFYVLQYLLAEMRLSISSVDYPHVEGGEIAIKTAGGENGDEDGPESFNAAEFCSSKDGHLARVLESLAKDVTGKSAKFEVEYSRMWGYSHTVYQMLVLFE